MTEERDLSAAKVAESAAGPPAVPAGAGFPVFLRDSIPFVLLRLVLYLALFETIGYGLSALLVRMAPWTAAQSVAGLLIQEVLRFTAAAGTALIMAKAERRSFGAYGLPARNAFGMLFWQGALLGLAELCAVMSLIAVFGGYRFGPLAIHGAGLLRWGPTWAFFFLAVGFSEEFLFRGYVQFTLAKGIGFWPAAVFLSTLFAAAHLGKGNAGENWVGALGILVIGLFWCLTLRRTGSLWFAVGMHASFDFGETFLFSVPNSGVTFQGHLSKATMHGPAWLTGGAVGPEASIFDFLIIGLLFYLFHRWYPAKAEPTRE